MPTWGRDNTGRFPDRPFYQQSEIERIARETLESVAQAAGLTNRYPVTDDLLELLADSLSESFDPLKNMSQVGLDVDGYTVFSRTGKPQIYVNEDLSSKLHRPRRRMTIAHEIGHAVLHQALYEKDDRQLDLLMPPELVPVYCARTEVVRSVDWCEWQANFFAGTLLMPSEILRARLFAKDPAFLEPRSLNSRDGGAVVALVAREFDVSKDAARVRLSQIGLLKPEALQKLEHLG